MGRRHEQTFFQRRHTNGQQTHEKKMLNNTYHQEIQIKTTMGYHLTPVKMAKINNTGKNDRCQRHGERGTLLHCWRECKLVQPLQKTL